MQVSAGRIRYQQRSLRGGKAEAVASVERQGLEDFKALGIVDDRAQESVIEKL